MTMREKKISVSFIILTIVFFLILLLFTWILHDVQDNQTHIEALAKDNASLAKTNRILIRENHARLVEIQDSRVESCKKTYEGISNVFKPFFPPPPQTAEQKAQLEKFNTTVAKLKNGCSKQVNSPKE